MIDFNSEQFQLSLANTVAWCAAQSPGGNQVDMCETGQRRALYEQASKLLEEARISSNRGLLKQRVSDTDEWRAASTLLQKVRDSFGPLELRLRSASLKPNFDLEDFETEASWAEAASNVVSARAQLMAGILPEQDRGEKVGGRLLLYNPSENLADGAAQQSSNGFFDQNNVPPWDIWVSFSEWTLVSWVPPALIEAAQMGIDVNPENCIRWAE
jgi:hypothetical protein